MKEEKKRFQITLTKSVVEEFQKLEREMRMPQGTMSNLIDESLRKTTAAIKRFREKGNVTFADLFSAVGEELDKINEEVDEEKSKKERENLCPKCGLPLHKFHNCELNPTAEGKKNAKSSRKTKKVEG